MKIISVIQQKGGVGKTTTVANLSAALAKSGFKILLVDLDPQANLTTSFGIDGENGPGIADLFAACFNGHNPSTSSFCIPAVEKVDILRGSMRLAQVEAHMGRTDGTHQYLSQLLDNVSSEYDICIIDCAPSLSTLTVNALVCSDWTLAPMQPEFLPLAGLAQLTSTVTEAREINPKLKFMGVLLTFVPRPQTKVTREVIDIMVEQQVPLMKAMIPRTIRLAEGPKHGIPLVLTQPKLPASQLYFELADEVASKLELSKPAELSGEQA